MVKKRLPNKSKAVPIGPPAKVAVQGLLSYGEQAMTVYGVEVNQSRAIPDFYDGLNPVSRRILYAMSQIDGGKTLVKSARIAGTVMGRFHPHSDAYGTIVNLVSLPQSPIIGQGNWGTIIDGAAASRYTEAKLSDYGHSFMQPDYFHQSVTDYIPNYDDTTVEPAVLPALVPNLLINPSEGVGVGMTSKIPGFTLKSVISVCQRLLSGEELTTVDYMKALTFQNAYGGSIINNKANRIAIKQLFETGQGTVKFKSNLEINEDQRSIRWADFAPGISLENAVDRIKGLNGIEKVQQTTDKKGVSFTIYWGRSLKSEKEIAAVIDKIEKQTSSSMSYKINVCETNVTAEGKRKVRIHFSVPLDTLFRMWLKRRVKLEVKSLTYRESVLVQQIALTKLMMYAIDNLEVIFKAIKTDEPAEYLVKHLKVTLIQANQILDKTVRSLSKLSKANEATKLKTQEDHLKEIRAWLKSPVRKVNNDLGKIASAL